MIFMIEPAIYNADLSTQSEQSKHFNFRLSLKEHKLLKSL